MIRPRRIPWMRDAACLEFPQEWWFVDRGASGIRARHVCRGCLVRQECLVYALEHAERYGIWGGYSHPELGRLRRPQPCPGCHRPIPADEVAAFVIKGVERQQWICRRCRNEQIQARRRA